ncbi:hypothetical protein roselon_00604 [Roseibacterium elongatum DSM 19469]|uniref:Uncharacterized protein n=1 Tax=Roseicyclus elongatus DSM 19469 TaxID=1294273 RepID=W8RPG2_9RHOB|nr:hypothetical protein [Roseibacterium elongatum]AHM03044.1 hypothetical protein roselon_00604 [Roseibacterium elongatum DSM 19469]
MKTQEDIQTRIGDLRQERERLTGELEKARVEERDALIAGKKPGSTSAAIIARMGTVDEALAELNDRLAATQASAQRNERRKRAEAALHKNSERAKLAEQVDRALVALSEAWPAYVEALRRDLGATSAAGGDLTAVERGLTSKRLAEPLVKALIHAGGGTLARALGIETPIKDRHSLSLAAAEERVAASLRAELLRVRATSPQAHVAREAQQELEKMEKSA